ncbi:DUF6906 family protein [Listeria cornellensis]|uniref:DUF6906 domain-containing protein n=1 Tax=Listeria cornellensis FSL F6-0969 TaxID=1265820 RepID=W7C3W1_9LIST|nr:hypothetical protein PCORN_13452 [Listeria cornellensis FSL F6-0969]
MKQGKRPTKRQSIFITSHRLVAANWLVVKDTSIEMQIKHRVSGKVRMLYK